MKSRPWPDMGTATQEGAEKAPSTAEEAGYERACEDAERLQQVGCDLCWEVQKTGSSCVFSFTLFQCTVA